MPVIYQKRICRDDLIKNRDVLYVFGDNDRRTGYGGQANEMRDEPNAVGVRTKKFPGNSSHHYYTDTEYEENCQKIHEDMVPLFEHVTHGGIVIIPTDGLGTGFARLSTCAPHTLRFLENKLRRLAQCLPA